MVFDDTERLLSTVRILDGVTCAQIFLIAQIEPYWSGKQAPGMQWM